MAKYYVICDDDCRYEGMTKEQILASIEQALEQGYVSDPDAAVFSKIKEVCAGDAIQLWVGSEAEFNALSLPSNVGRAFVRVGENGIIYLCADDSSADAFEDHMGNTNNPHNVTFEQTLGNMVLCPNHYAEEVKTVGRWIDGKPIYTRVIVLQDIDSKTTLEPFVASDIETMWIDPSATFLSAYLNERRVYPLGAGRSAQDSELAFSVYCVPPDGKIEIYISDIFGGKLYMCVKVCYTKKTDTAKDDYGPETGLDNVILA